MAGSSARRQSTPLLVARSGNGEHLARPLARRPFKRDDIDEGWLQDLIYRHPALLSVEEIEPDYSPLIPLGREVPTDVGPIDCLYISPNGLLTLVEAKLWKNPEARREVVGQILDYANHLAGWNYEDLDAYARRTIGTRLWDLLEARAGELLDLEEAEFIDAVTRNLSRGRFLLLIVGDGIKESTETLAAFLQGTPDLRFTLALIEMRVYDMPGGEDLLVVPAVVARTREMVRAVIDVRDEGGRIRVTTPEAEPPLQRGQDYRTRIDDLSFYDSIKAALGPEGVIAARAFLDAAEERDWVRVEPGDASRMVRVVDPGGSGSFTLFGVHKLGHLFVGWLAGQTVRAGIEFTGSPAETYLKSISTLLGCDLVTASNSPAPEFWRQKPSVIEALVHHAVFFRHLDVFVAAVRDSATPSTPQ
jgi:hypothetical protein